MCKDMKETLNKTKFIIDALLDLEASEGITDDDILEIIEPLTEGMHSIRRRLKEDTDNYQEDKYSIKESKEDTFRKMAVGY